MGAVFQERDRNSKLMHKAELLGFETRSVPRLCLEPLVLTSRTQPSSPQPPSSPQGYAAPYHGPMHGGLLYRSSPNRTSPAGRASPGSLGSSPWAGLRGHNGGGNGFADDRSHHSRSSRKTHDLGDSLTKKFSKTPERDNLDLIMLSHRRIDGKLPRRGQKAAAVRRARRGLSQGPTFKKEVPFADALRVACSQKDFRASLPSILATYLLDNPHLSLPQLDQEVDLLARQRPAVLVLAATQLMQAGFFFSAVRILYSEGGLLRAGLDEMRLLLEPSLSDPDWEAAAAGWTWHELDRMLFIRHFKDLQVISHYKTLRRSLVGTLQPQGTANARAERDHVARDVHQHGLEPLSATLGGGAGSHHDNCIRTTLTRQGGAALARAEREMLMMVVVDLQAELEEEEHGLGDAEQQDVRALNAAKAEAWARAQSKARAREERRRQGARFDHDPTAPAKSRVTNASASRTAAEDDEDGAQYYSSSSEESAATLQRQNEYPSVAPNGATNHHLTVERSAGSWPMMQKPPMLQPPYLNDSSSIVPLICQRAPQRVVRALWGRQNILKEPADGEDEQYEASAVQLQPTPPPRDSPRNAAPPPSVTVGAETDVVSPAPVSRSASIAASAPTSPPAVAAFPRASSRRSEAEAQPPMARAASHRSEAAATTPVPPPATAAAAVAQPVPSVSRAASNRSVAAPPGAVEPPQPPPAAAEADAPEAAAAVAAVTEPAESETVAEAASPVPTQDEGAEAVLSRTARPKRQPRPEVAAKEEQSDAAADQAAQGAVEADAAGAAAAAAAATDAAAAAAAAEAAAAEAAAAEAATAEAAAAAAEAEASAAAAAETEATAAAAAVAAAAASAAEAAASAAAAAEPPAAVAPSVLPASRPSSRMGTPRSGSRRQPLTVEEQAAVDEGLVSMRRTMAEERVKTAEATERLKRQISVARPLSAAAENGGTGQERPATSEAAVDPAALRHEIERHMNIFDNHLSTLAAQVRQAAQSRHHSACPTAACSRLGSMSGPDGVTRSPASVDANGDGNDAAHADFLERSLSVLDDPPTKEEIDEYARFLGIDVDADPELVHIAEWAITAPLPEGWTVHLDGEQREFFFNVVTGASTYEHPMDDHYRAYYLKAKADKQAAAGA